MRQWGRRGRGIDDEMTGQVHIHIRSRGGGRGGEELQKKGNQTGRRNNDDDTPPPRSWQNQKNCLHWRQ